jgi:hypothetical protein
MHGRIFFEKKKQKKTLHGKCFSMQGFFWSVYLNINAFVFFCLRGIFYECVVVLIFSVTLLLV